MNYIKLIRRFWLEVETTDFLPSEACVYFRLVEVCNQLGWQNPFPLAISRAVGLMAMNERTFRTVRDKLAGRGLIEFRAGENRKSPQWYCFPEKGEKGKFVFPWPDSFAENITGKNTEKIAEKIAENIAENIADDITGKITPLNIYTNKTKTIKSPNGDSAVAVKAEKTLFGDEEKKAKKKPKAEKGPEPATPTLEQVKQHFLAVDADKRLENWEASAALFFDTFNADGWVNRRGRSVAERTKWESEANKWIFYREEQEKKNKTDETRQDGKYSERRGSEPGTASRKGFKGTF